ncbi:MAG: glycosyltransferase [Candidatus Ornithospirochaeta sp.]
MPASWLGRKTLVYVGRLGFEKSVDLIIKAFPKVLKAIPDAKFICIGGGPAESMLKNLVDEYNLSESVIMTGLVPNETIIGSGILKNSGAFVSASITENQAMTVIEALCSGLPVVCADVPNMRAIVGEDMGWFFKGEDVEDLSKKMIDALSDVNRDEKAKNAYSSKDRFDGRNEAKAFVEIYNELLERKATGWRPDEWDMLVI